MSTGIDYGRGQTNIDHATGIRYGVISQRSLNSDAADDIWQNGENLSHKAAVDDVKSQLKSALEPILDDIGVLPYVWNGEEKVQDDYVTDVVDKVWDSIEQDFNDRYEESDDQYRYESEGYIIETSSLGLYIIKSPYVTRARFCSPCAPGAGDLDSPDTNGVLTYCLGSDWFDGDQAPYPIMSADEVARE